jgi:hypothetical protein
MLHRLRVTSRAILRVMRRQGLGWSGFVLIAGLCWTGAARADIAPRPERPKDWDEHPAPTPDVPFEDALARRLLPWVALGISALTAAAAARRVRILASAERGR